MSLVVNLIETYIEYSFKQLVIMVIIYHLWLELRRKNLISIVDILITSFYCLARLDRRKQMSKTWQLQDAKNKFSEVVEEALRGEPQIITRRGRETAVVLSYENFQSMKVCKHSLSTFFQKSPLSGIKLEIRRDSSTVRDSFKI